MIMTITTWNQFEDEQEAKRKSKRCSLHTWHSNLLDFIWTTKLNRNWKLVKWKSKTKMKIWWESKLKWKANENPKNWEKKKPDLQLEKDHFKQEPMNFSKIFNWWTENFKNRIFNSEPMNPKTKKKENRKKKILKRT